MSAAGIRLAFGQNTQPTLKPLENTDFTLASRMNLDRRVESVQAGQVRKLMAYTCARDRSETQPCKRPRSPLE